jgi:DivIVA domain-containing protein
MALTPEEVESKRFQPTKFREGYDQVEVDDFLDIVVTELRRLTAENEDLRQRLSACEQSVGELTRAAESGSAGTATAAAQQEDRAQPAPPQAAPPEPAAAERAAAAVVAEGGAPGPGGSPAVVTGLLAMAQQLHDDYVRSGEEQRDKILTEAREHAARLVGEAEQMRRDTLGSLERERSLLERKIDELRAYEREYRSRLKAYLESQLQDLETRGSLVPSGVQDDGDGAAGQGGS